jgi:hypothetical protein
VSRSGLPDGPVDNLLTGSDTGSVISTTPFSLLQPRSRFDSHDRLTSSSWQARSGWQHQLILITSGSNNTAMVCRPFESYWFRCDNIAH